MERKKGTKETIFDVMCEIKISATGMRNTIKAFVVVCMCVYIYGRSRIKGRGTEEIWV